MTGTTRQGRIAAVDVVADDARRQPNAIAVFSSINGHAQAPVQIEAGNCPIQGADVAAVRIAARTGRSAAPPRAPRLAVR